MTDIEDRGSSGRALEAGLNLAAFEAFHWARPDVNEEPRLDRLRAYRLARTIS
jgi:hypothetical protein